MPKAGKSKQSKLFQKDFNLDFRKSWLYIFDNFFLYGIVNVLDAWVETVMRVGREGCEAPACQH